MNEQPTLPIKPAFDLIPPTGLCTPRAFVRAILEADTQVSDYGIDSWAFEYAEPGYKTPESGILFGNWNDKDRYDPDTKTRIKVSDLPSRFAKIAEYAGYAIEWSDEWITCENCNKAIRTSPDCYSWTPSYVLLRECSVVCLECLDNVIEDYLSEMIGESNRVIPENVARHIDFEAHGFTQVNEEAYESGFHPGQEDTGPKVIKTLTASGVITDDTEWLFVQDEQSQFYIRFSLWIRKVDHEA